MGSKVDKDMESTAKIMESNREALRLMGDIVEDWVKDAETRGATIGEEDDK